MNRCPGAERDDPLVEERLLFPCSKRAVGVLHRDGVLELGDDSPGEAGHDAVDVDGPTIRFHLLLEFEIAILQLDRHGHQDLVAAEPDEVGAELVRQGVVVDVRGHDAAQILEFDLRRTLQVEVLLHALERHVLGPQVAGRGVVGRRRVE